MRRSKFITMLGGAVPWTIMARAQQGGHMRRVGMLLSGADDPRVSAQLSGFRDGLAKLGWVEGSKIQIDYRFAAGNADRFSALAKELIALNPDVIFAQSTPATATLQREARTIPIVFVEVRSEER